MHNEFINSQDVNNHQKIAIDQYEINKQKINNLNEIKNINYNSILQLII